MSELEKELKHWGVKGMHWGVRKDSSDSSGTTSDKPSGGAASSKISEDAARAKAAKQQFEKHGINSLSNEQMKDLSKRIELESKVNAWAQANPTLKKQAKEFAKAELKTYAFKKVGLSKKDTQVEQIAGVVGKLFKEAKKNVNESSAKAPKPFAKPAGTTFKMQPNPAARRRSSPSTGRQPVYRVTTL